MRRLTTVALAAALLAPLSLEAQANQPVPIKEWPVEWAGRPRDPYVAPDGKVWFVGQAGNYIAHFDPTAETFKRFEIEAGTNPHNLIVDPKGQVWYTGNRNGRIGKLDPATGKIQTFPMPDPAARDPHTAIFDGKGNIFFTLQGSSMIGRLKMATGEIKLVKAGDQPANPYGIILDNAGNPWVALFRTNTVVRVNPETLELTPFKEASETSRSRRIEWTSDGMVWYVDEPRGFLGRINPKTGEVKEWQAPGGPGSRPYALTKDDKGRLWFSETGPVKQLVGFDPRTERFFSVNSVSNTIRHMMFDVRTGMMWFGTDSNNIGRAIVSPRTT
jgi:virginiamycin B lyase